MYTVKNLLHKLRLPLLIVAGLAILLLVFLGWIRYSAHTHNDEHILFRGSTLPILPDTLSLITWNIGYAGLSEGMDFFYDGGREVRPSEATADSAFNAIQDFISNDTDAKIYLLQEVDAGSRRSWNQPQVNVLGSLKPAYHGYFALNYDVAFVPSPLRSPMGKVKSGLLTLTDYQPAEVIRYALPGSDPWPTRLFLPRRCLLLMRYPLAGGGTLTVVNVHNSAYDEGGVQRAEQMAFISRLLGEEYARGNFVIAGGDFNQSPQGYDPSVAISGDLVLSSGPELPDSVLQGWTRAFDPLIPSNRSVDEPYKQGRTRTTLIDYFLLSPNIRLLEVRTYDLGFRWSDHQPVEVKVMLGDQP
jgi:endonuclease/exonuclease/phosphatase family metal-dependent hydrolase